MKKGGDFPPGGSGGSTDNPWLSEGDTDAPETEEAVGEPLDSAGYNSFDQYMEQGGDGVDSSDPVSEGASAESGAEVDSYGPEVAKALKDIYELDPSSASDVKQQLELGTITSDQVVKFLTFLSEAKELEAHCEEINLNELLTPDLRRFEYSNALVFLDCYKNHPGDWLMNFLNDPQLVERAKAEIAQVEKLDSGDSSANNPGDASGANPDVEPGAVPSVREQLLEDARKITNSDGSPIDPRTYESLSEDALRRFVAVTPYIIDIVAATKNRTYDELSDTERKKIDEAGLKDALIFAGNFDIATISAREIDEIKALAEKLKKIDLSEASSKDDAESNPVSPEMRKCLDRIALFDATFESEHPDVTFEQAEAYLQFHLMWRMIARKFNGMSYEQQEEFYKTNGKEIIKISDDHKGGKSWFDISKEVDVDFLRETINGLDAAMAKAKGEDDGDPFTRVNELVDQIKALDEGSYDVFKDSPQFKELIDEANEEKLTEFLNFLTRRKDLLERCSGLTDDFRDFVKGKPEYAALGRYIDISQKPVRRSSDLFKAFSKGTVADLLSKAEAQFSDASRAFEASKSDTSGENGEDEEKLAQKREIIDRLLNMKNYSNTLEKLGLDASSTLEEADKILLGKQLEDLQKLERELNADKKLRWKAEELEGLRRMTFGQWFEGEYGGSWGSDNFFEAPREKQREAIRRYMEIFEPNANYEMDRGPMIQALLSADLIVATLKGLGLDVGNSPTDAEKRMNGMTGDEINKLYNDVKGGKYDEPNNPPKKNDQSQPKPQPARPKPTDGGDPTGGPDDNEPAAKGNGSGDDGTGPDAAPDVSHDAKQDADKAKKYDELLKKYSKEKMPASEDEILLKARSDARCLRMIDSEYGYKGDAAAFAKEVARCIDAWNNASDDLKREFLSINLANFMSSAGVFEDFIYLARLGFLPDPLKI